MELNFVGLSLFLGSLGAYKYQIWRGKIRSALPVFEHTDDIILAIDIGSSSVRCGAFKVEKLPDKIRHVTNYDVAVVRKNIDHGYANAIQILADVNFVVEGCIKNLGEIGIRRVKYVGLSCFAMSLVGLDDNGDPCTKVFTYAGECSVGEETAGLSAHDHFTRTGTVLSHPCYAPTQLRNFYSNSSTSKHPVVSWQTLSGFILGKWCRVEKGQCPISLSDASWTGLLNINTLQWCEHALKHTSITQSCSVSSTHPMPPLNVTGAPLRGLGPSFLREKEWTPLQDALFFSGIADGFAANVASKCFMQPEIKDDMAFSSSRSVRLAVTIGTSAAVRMVCPFQPSLIERAAVDCPGLWVYRTSAENVIVGGALTDGGSLVDWLSSFIGPEKVNSLTKDIRQMYKDGRLLDITVDQPVVLPFWAGERSVGWHSDARGTIHGITRNTTPLLMLLSLMEGTMMRIAEILRRVKIVCGASDSDDTTGIALNGEIKFEHDLKRSSRECIVASGAVLEKYWIWRQLLADICDIPVVLLKRGNGEMTMRGTALQALSLVPIGDGHDYHVENARTLEENIDMLFGLPVDDIEEVQMPDARYVSMWKERKLKSNELYDRMMI